MSTSTIEPIHQEEKYYTFRTPGETRHKLHVVDPDYGLFDRNAHKTGFGFNTKKFMRKIRGRKSTEDFQISNEFQLRAEPEIYDSGIQELSVSPERLFPDLPIDSESSESDTESIAECESVFSGQAISNSLIGSKSRSISRNSGMSQKKTALTFSDILCRPKKTSPIQYKTKIEMEYEKLKIKAARHKAEKEALKCKLLRKEMASKMRDYEYYCINRIEHRHQHQPHNRKQGRPVIQDSLPIAPSCYFPNKTLKGSRGSIRHPLSQLCDKLPSDISEALRYSASMTPTTRAVEDFHRYVEIWVSGLPLVNVIWPVLHLIGAFIPRGDPNSRSLVSLVVAFIDLLILYMTGLATYYFTYYAYKAITSLLYIGKLFHLM